MILYVVQDRYTGLGQQFQKQEFQFTTNKYKRGHQGNVGPSLDNLWPVGKSGVAMLPAESDGEEHIVYVRCITAVHQIEMEAKYIF